MSSRGAEFNAMQDTGIKKGGLSADYDIEISDQEIAERMDRLRAIGRTIGKDFAMKVEIGKEPGWRYKFKPINTIEVDPNDVRQKGLEYCFGLIAHEGAHRRVSRMDFISKEQWQESGFSFLMNAVEDPRVNNWVREKYEGAIDWLERVYNEIFSAEDGIDNKAKEKLGYTPKHIRYGLEVIRYWHIGQFSEDVPDEVRMVLDKTISNAVKAYETLPKKEPVEDEIVEKAKKMFEIVLSKIWPEYKKLVDKSIDDETVRQMIKDMVNNNELDLPKEASMGGDKKTEKKEKGEKSSEPLPLDQMSKEAREEIEKKLKEKLEGMSEEERENFFTEMEVKAREILDELETDLDKIIKGKFSDQPETKTEEKGREEFERKEAEDAKKIAEELAAARKELDKKLEAEKSEYQRAYEEVKPYIDKVADDLMNIFIVKRFPLFRPGFPGQKLRLKGAMAYEGQKDYKGLFERRLPTERSDYTFLLLVDLSGSMAGEKIEETFKGTVLFAEALAKVASTLGAIKVAVYGFQNELIPYKEFESDMDDTVRNKMSIMKNEVSNKGDFNQSIYNNDGYCVEGASAILREQSGTNNFLVILSDGQPCGDSVHRVERYASLEQGEELKAVIEDISKAGDQHVLGIGLGPGTEHVSGFYRDNLPNIANIPNVKVSGLAEVLADKLKELIK
jgi:hypothetical protein